MPFWRAVRLQLNCPVIWVLDVVSQCPFGGQCGCNLSHGHMSGPPSKMWYPDRAGQLGQA